MIKHEAEAQSTGRIVIVGVGNLLLKDEGIGIHCAQALQKLNLPANVVIIDGGTSPDFIAYVKPGDKLIIIDAVKTGGEVGAIYRFTPDALDSQTEVPLSLHELGLTESLKMMHLVGNTPRETVIIGIEPKEIDFGTELSGDLQQQVPDVIEVILKEIQIVST